MNLSSITNAQVLHAKQLFDAYKTNSISLNSNFFKQTIYLQFLQILFSIVDEVADSYSLSSKQTHCSLMGKIDFVLAQAPQMAELNILKNAIEMDSSFINKILNFKVKDELLSSNDSIFKTYNAEEEIILEIENLIRSIRELSIQQ